MALLPVKDAIQRILEGVTPTSLEDVALLSASHRTLGADVAAKLTQPPFDVSAMDGYAVIASDVTTVPVTLDCIGESAAGRRFQGDLKPDQCVRIFTGAAMPVGADAVVIQEDTSVDGRRITMREAVSAQRNVRARGIDFEAGQPLLKRGRILDARAITLAAAMGHPALPCHRRPRVAILATGDELVMPGTEPGPDQIVCSNSFGLAALVENAGGEPIVLGIARDTQAALAEKIKLALGADILVTTGGASVGDHDLVAPALQNAGMTLDFWKIAMRPGKPMMFGKLGDMRVLGLPGNPVSSMICGRLFLVPLIRRLLGHEDAAVVPTRAITTAAIEPNGPRTHYMRARLDASPDGLPRVTPVASQDSSLVAPLAAASCLIVRDVGQPAASAGDEVAILHLDF
jgi:molybdopterin molybdotransferase